MHHYLKNVLYVLILFFPFCLQANDIHAPHQTICLNMIVKNEKEVITRCLSSMLPIIDYWVIVDTGSTDGTEQIITDFMKAKGVPGELHRRPWVDFSHNRNEALELAKGKGDYVFFIDADEYLVYATDFIRPKLDKDYYFVTTKCPGMDYGRMLCINNHLDWKWEGVIHEMIYPPASRSYETLTKLSNITTTDGARSKDPQKLEKDAQTLETALKEDPNNSRYIFYLAQTYFSMRNFSQALQNYEKRLELKGWDQEIFWSKLRIAQIQELLEMPPDAIVKSYKAAYQCRPTRAEPLYHLAHYHRKKGEYALGYDVAKIGLTLPVSKDILFVEHWVNDFGLFLEFSICAYWVNRFEECQKVCVHLLKQHELPPDVRECVEKNLGCANVQLLERTGTKKS